MSMLRASISHLISIIHLNRSLLYTTTIWYLVSIKQRSPRIYEGESK